MFAPLAAVLAVLNLAALAAFGLDKALAGAGRRRIPEARLLQLAVLGGTPGAYAGRALFRHKTRKQPFSARLHRIALVQGLAVIAAVGWAAAGRG